MFRSGEEVNQRLLDAKPLTDEEVMAAMQWLNWLRDNQRQRLQIESTRLNTIAIQEFNKGSTRLTKWMMGLVGLQIVIAVLQVVLILIRK